MMESSRVSAVEEGGGLLCISPWNGDARGRDDLA
jgi:hypothetical protein